MSSSLKFNLLSNMTILLAAILLAGTLFQHSGISLASAHCTNAANKHYNFQRNFTRTYTMAAEKTLATHMRKGHNARFSLDLRRAGPLHIAIQSNRPSEINHQLFFNETVNLSRYFTRNASAISIPCAPTGKYDLLLMSKGNVQLKVNVSQPQTFNNHALAQYVHPSRIRFESQFQKRQVLLKWDKSKLDIHVMQYCLAINTHENQDTFCDAVDLIVGQSPKMFCSHLKALNNYFMRPAGKVVDIDSKRGSALACTGLRNKQVVRGLIPNKKYFVDIFGIHQKINEFTFKLASTTLIFNRTNPIELKEDKVEIGKISEFEKKSAFSFRPQRNHSKQASSVTFLIVPCGFPVRVKLFTQKKLKVVEDITHATTMTFGVAKANDRFLLKFMASNPDDKMQNSKINYRIAATTQERFTNFPTLPLDTKVHEITSLSTCKSSTITWHSSPDSRPITYCVAIIKNKPKSFDDSYGSVNNCEMEKLSSKMFTSVKYDCFPPSANNSVLSSHMERYQLTNLTPGYSYIIQVMLKLNDQVLSYQTLNMPKNLHCYKPKLAERTKQFKKQPPIQPNNIFT